MWQWMTEAVEANRECQGGSTDGPAAPRHTRATGLPRGSSGEAVPVSGPAFCPGFSRLSVPMTFSSCGDRTRVPASTQRACLRPRLLPRCTEAGVPRSTPGRGPAEGRVAEGEAAGSAGQVLRRPTRRPPPPLTG